MTVFPDIEESCFVDSVNESLCRGDFLLAIAGDGIRSDLHALKHLLANQGGLLARLALLEIRLFKDARGRTLLVPNVPVQTEVVRREVYVGVGRERSVEPPIPPRSERGATRTRPDWKMSSSTACDLWSATLQVRVTLSWARWCSNTSLATTHSRSPNSAPGCSRQPTCCSTRCARDWRLR
jgi:hypothetical protein